MVEAGEGGVQLFARYAEVAGQCGERVHGAVTEPDTRTGLGRDGAHVGGQRVAVVDHEATGCELGHVPRDRDQFGHVPQRSQHAARPYGVAHGLVTPCRAGTSTSCSQPAAAPTAIVVVTKLAPASALRRSV